MADYKSSAKAWALDWLILNAVQSSATFIATCGPGENRKLTAWDPVKPSKSLAEESLIYIYIYM